MQVQRDDLVENLLVVAVKDLRLRHLPGDPAGFHPVATVDDAAVIDATIPT